MMDASSIRLRMATLGFAIAEADNGVREQGGQNRGERVEEYLRNLVPPIDHAAPWCAAWVQYCADAAARALGLDNPLDGVRLEAYVQSYYGYLESNGQITPRPLAGDLVLFSFGGERWDHMGFVLRPPETPEEGLFWTVEGNTSGEGGDGVYSKLRRRGGSYDVCFARWAE